MESQKKLISIVIPAYNEQENIPLIVKEIMGIMSEFSEKYDCELIIVNDGSTDNSWEVIIDENANNPKVVGINLSRNFGHQLALTAGFDHAKGDAIIYCDADLQHPPEIFKQLLVKWEEGHKVVHTIRLETEGEPFLKRTMSKLFYKVVNLLSDISIEKGMADFKLIDKVVLDKVKLMKEHNRFLRGMVPWVGYKSAYVTYTARKRIHGKPWYSFGRNLEFAKTGIMSFSIKPLKYIGYLGILLTFASLMMIAIGTVLSLYYGSWFFSPVITLSLFNTLLIGVVLISIGILSLYVSFIYFEVINRPLYIVSDTTNGQ